MIGSSETDEKREFFRMGVECDMTFQIGGSKEIHSGIARNMSSAGLLIATDIEVPAGSLLYVKVQPEKSFVPPFEAIVEVLRVERSAAGIYELGATVRQAKS